MRVTTLVLGMLGTNCHILIDIESGNSAVIDPADRCESILAGLEGTTPVCILLTHAHFDHILALDKLRDATGAPVYMHKNDAEMLLDAEKNCSLPVLRRNLTFRPPEFPCEDGEVIRIGKAGVKLLHTPGHTKGSCCYLCGDKLFSGDTLFANGVGRTDLYGGDENALLSSLQKIRDLPGDYEVFPGHGEPTTLGEERSMNPWMNPTE